MRMSKGKSIGDREEINGQRENAFSVLNILKCLLTKQRNFFSVMNTKLKRYNAQHLQINT